MEIELYILILTPLFMMLGTSIITRENREANAKLQRDLEARRSARDTAAAKQHRIDQNLLRRGYLYGFKCAMEDLAKGKANQH